MCPTGWAPQLLLIANNMIICRHHIYRRMGHVGQGAPRLCLSQNLFALLADPALQLGREDCIRHIHQAFGHRREVSAERVCDGVQHYGLAQLAPANHPLHLHEFSLLVYIHITNTFDAHYLRMKPKHTALQSNAAIACNFGFVCAHLAKRCNATNCNGRHLQLAQRCNAIMPRAI